MPGALGTATTDMLPQLEVSVSMEAFIHSSKSPSPRASVHAPSPWLVGIHLVMETLAHLPGTSTTSSSEHCKKDVRHLIVVNW